MSEMIAKDFFVYSSLFSSIAAAASQTQSIVIQADSDFVAEKLTLSADVAGASQSSSSLVVPLCSLVITDTGSGRQLMDQAVPLQSLFGNGQLPFILPQPKLFAARTSIQLTLANYSAATTYRIWISLIGEKIFRR